LDRRFVHRLLGIGSHGAATVDRVHHIHGPSFHAGLGSWLFPRRINPDNRQVTTRGRNRTSSKGSFPADNEQSRCPRNGHHGSQDGPAAHSRNEAMRFLSGDLRYSDIIGFVADCLNIDPARDSALSNRIRILFLRPDCRLY
jgi:hypothetical protein